MAEQEYAIAAENLVKVYGKGRIQVEALKDVSLAVRHGELFAIMGPSGSGKTMHSSISWLGNASLFTPYARLLPCQGGGPSH